MEKTRSRHKNMVTTTKNVVEEELMEDNKTENKIVPEEETQKKLIKLLKENTCQ